MVRQTLFSIIAVLIGCDVPYDDGGDLTGRTVLLSADSWAVDQGTGRPSPGVFFEQERPCPDASIAVEDDYLEVNTTYCADVTLTQGLRQAVPKGTELHFSHWHLNLWNPQPVIGRFALSANGDVLLEREFEIPGEAAFEEAVFTSPQELAVGTEIILSLSNHGLNSWRFGDLHTSATTTHMEP